LFRLDTLTEPERDWLGEHLADGEKLIAARFRPEEMPLVVVPDRDAELKRRLEADDNDKRMSTAALRLARQFTAKIDGGHLSRLYLNLDNPAVQALLQAVRGSNPRAAQAVRLLRSFKVIIAGQGHGKGAPSLQQALADLAVSVRQLLTPDC
jgi:molecular chaperone HtpG